MDELDELHLFSNQITGSFPSQLGKLRNISSISVAYNLLKGTVPIEFSSTRNLSLLHLHGNSLVGDLNHFDYSIKSFISDCGNSEVFTAKIDCGGCSECCNDEGGCINVLETWPKAHAKCSNAQPAGFVVLMLLLSTFILSLVGMIIMIINRIRKRGKRSLPQLSRLVCQNSQQDSTNRWFLSSKKRAWFIATLTNVDCFYVHTSRR